jgi:hypothetical protein
MRGTHSEVGKVDPGTYLREKDEPCCCIRTSYEMAGNYVARGAEAVIFSYAQIHRGLFHRPSHLGPKEPRETRFLGFRERALLQQQGKLCF